MKAKDFTGHRFGELVAIERTSKTYSSGRSVTAWRLKCSCGTEVVASQANLVSGKYQSCGCRRHALNWASRPRRGTCTILACSDPHYAHGFCKKHYTRLLRHGDPQAGRTPCGDLERFYREVVLPYEGDECIAWPFSRTSSGYGKIYLGGQHLIVSRLSCEEANGAPPTPEHQAAHSCGNGHLGCVTKRHLSWKTSLGNAADKKHHGEKFSRKLRK